MKKPKTLLTKKNIAILKELKARMDQENSTVFVVPDVCRDCKKRPRGDKCNPISDDSCEIKL